MSDAGDGVVAGTERIEEIPISGDTIPLGAFLKVAGIAPTGGAAKVFIQDGQVTVNGVTETRRRHPLSDGDVVRVGGAVLRVRTDG